MVKSNGKKLKNGRIDSLYKHNISVGTNLDHFQNSIVSYGSVTGTLRSGIQVQACLDYIVFLITCL